jgi:hypothetical protein
MEDGEKNGESWEKQANMVYEAAFSRIFSFSTTSIFF